MKFLFWLLVCYLVYRYFIRPAKPLQPPQEPDLYIPHEEVKQENEKNQ